MAHITHDEDSSLLQNKKVSQISLSEKRKHLVKFTAKTTKTYILKTFSKQRKEISNLSEFESDVVQQFFRFFQIGK